MVKNNAIRVQLAVGWLVNIVFTIMQANLAAGTRQINKSILLTNRKLSTIHSESVPRRRSKASTYSYAKNKTDASVMHKILGCHRETTTYSIQI